MESLECRVLLASDIVGALGGTASLIDVNKGPANFLVTGSTEYRDDVVFLASDGDAEAELWRTNGTAAGTELIAAFPHENAYCGVCASDVVAVGDYVYFVIKSPTSAELWRSNGSTGGTELIQQLGQIQISESNTSVRLYAANERLLMAVTDWSLSDGVSQLWVSDGTKRGTVPYSEKFTWSFNAPIEPPVAFSGHWYFLGRQDTGPNVIGLWKTDPVSRSTELIRSFATQDPYFTQGITGLQVDGNKLIFSADDGDGMTTWQSDGTAGGTVRAGGDAVPFVSQLPEYPEYLGTAGANDIYFSELSLQNAKGENTFYSYADLSVGSNPQQVFLVGDRVLFLTAEPGEQSLTLWAADASGDQAVSLGGTVKHSYFDTTPTDFQPAAIGLVGDDALLISGSVGPNQVSTWSESGQVAAIDVGFDAPRVDSITGDGTLYAVFATYDDVFPSGRYSIWSSPDGTTQSLSELHASREYYHDVEYSQHDLYVIAGNQRGLVAVDASTGIETAIATDTVVAMTSASDGLYFLRGEDEERLLYFSDGSAEGTRQVSVVPARATAAPSDLIEFQQQIFVAPGDGTLWKFNPTTGGTTQVESFPVRGDIGNMFATDTTLFFSADDGVLGNELWMTDGTESAARLAIDVRPGPIGSSPHDLAQVGDRLFFAADDGVHGVELWSVGLTPTPTAVPGDANGDSLVDFVDFLVLAAAFGSTTDAGAPGGDFDANGVVDFMDFLILQNNYRPA